MSLITKWVKVEGRVMDVSRRQSTMLPGYAVVFSYRAGNRRYSGVYTLWRARSIGTTVKVEYDPKAPSRIRRLFWEKVLRFSTPVVLLGLFVLWVRMMQRSPY